MEAQELIAPTVTDVVAPTGGLKTWHVAAIGGVCGVAACLAYQQLIAEDEDEDEGKKDDSKPDLNSRDERKETAAQNVKIDRLTDIVEKLADVVSKSVPINITPTATV